MFFTGEKLYFRVLPEGYRNNERIAFLGIDFSGIQSFIFQDDNSGNLSEFTKRSGYIGRLTSLINEDLGALLGNFRYTAITVSSGKLQAVFKNNKKAFSMLNEYLVRVQGVIFAENEGKLQIFFGVIAARTSTKKPDGHENAFVSLMRTIDHNKYQCAGLYKLDLKSCRDKRYSIACLTGETDRAGKITVLETANLTTENPTTSKIDTVKLAAVKMDFDNLGSFFAGQKQADVKDEVSRTLAGLVDEAVKSAQNIRLIFAGGDDIFFLCPFDQLIKAVSELYQHIRRRIGNEPVLAGYSDVFGISCGVCIFHRDVPVIHYMDIAETQLTISKVSGKNRITIDNLSLKWDEVRKLSAIEEYCLQNTGPDKKKDMYRFGFERILQVLKDSAAGSEDREFLKRLTTVQ